MHKLLKATLTTYLMSYGYAVSQEIPPEAQAIMDRMGPHADTCQEFAMSQFLCESGFDESACANVGTYWQALPEIAQRDCEALIALAPKPYIELGINGDFYAMDLDDHHEFAHTHREMTFNLDVNFFDDMSKTDLDNCQQYIENKQICEARGNDYQKACQASQTFFNKIPEKGQNACHQYEAAIKQVAEDAVKGVFEKAAGMM